MEKGLEAASMAEIARRAGVGKSTLYEYFPSKDKMLEEACEELWEMVHDSLAEAFAKEETFRGKLLCYYQTVAAIMQQIGGNMLLLFTQQPIKDVLCECVGRFQKMLLELIGEAMAQARVKGELDPNLDLELAAVVLTTQINPILLVSAAPLGKEDVLEKVVDMLLSGIARKE